MPWLLPRSAAVSIRVEVLLVLESTCRLAVGLNSSCSCSQRSSPWRRWSAVPPGTNAHCRRASVGRKRARSGRLLLMSSCVTPKAARAAYRREWHNDTYAVWWIDQNEQGGNRDLSTIEQDSRRRHPAHAARDQDLPMFTAERSYLASGTNAQTPAVCLMYFVFESVYVFNFRLWCVW